jgi:hypothetical protein
MVNSDLGTLGVNVPGKFQAGAFWQCLKTVFMNIRINPNAGYRQSDFFNLVANYTLWIL